MRRLAAMSRSTRAGSRTRSSRWYTLCGEEHRRARVVDDGARHHGVEPDPLKFTGGVLILVELGTEPGDQVVGHAAPFPSVGISSCAARSASHLTRSQDVPHREQVMRSR